MTNLRRLSKIILKDLARKSYGHALQVGILPGSGLPFGRLWYGEPDAISNAIGCAKFFSCSPHAVIAFTMTAGNVIETHEHAGDFKEL